MADDEAQSYHCSYCRCDITLRLKCNVCHDFDLCLQCFASGASGSTHTPDHPYQLIDEGSFPLLTNDWGAIEEVLLLDAVEQDGFGNWEDIGAHVFTKTARESKDHYNEVYINSDIGEGLIAQVHHTKSDGGIGGEEIPPSPPSFVPVTLDHSEQQDLTYAPLRDDFEKEFDNDCENIISLVPVHHDEDSIEKDLKLAHIDMYSKRLIEREKRKIFAREHSLLGGKMRISSMKRKYSKLERDIRGKYQLFSRLLDKDNYEKFVNSLKKEKELAEKVRNLKEYRMNGITKMDDSIEIDLMKHDKSERSKENDQSDRTGDSSSQDLVFTPGLSLLSLKERKLCQSLNVQPQVYIDTKTEVMKVASLRLRGIPAKPSLPKSLSSDAKHQIIKYFYKSGWLN